MRSSECIMDDELIGSELSSEDDFKVGDVNALWKKKKKKKNREIVIFNAKFYVPLWYFFAHLQLLFIAEGHECSCITVLAFIDYAPSLL